MVLNANHVQNKKKGIQMKKQTYRQPKPQAQFDYLTRQFKTRQKDLIKDNKSTNNYGILLLNQQNLDNIRHKSEVNITTHDEYGFHYRALVARVVTGSGNTSEFLDICIPTVYYNYKQEVSGGEVEFHLADVEAAANEVKPLSDMMVNKLFESDISLGTRLNNLFNELKIKAEYFDVGVNSIHMHPAGLHRFSGGDLDTDHTNPGICFPLSKAEKETNFASIVTRRGKGVILGHTEYRIADGDVSTNEPINYYHGKSITLVKGYAPTDDRTTMQKLLGFKVDEPIKSYTVSDGLDLSDFANKVNELFNESDYVAFDDTVISDNVSKYVYKPKPVAKKKPAIAASKQKTITAKHVELKIVYTDKTTGDKYTQDDIDDIIEELMYSSTGVSKAELMQLEYKELVDRYEEYIMRPGSYSFGGFGYDYDY
jgi:hypothetical protein